MANKLHKQNFFEIFATKATIFTGRSYVFIGAMFLVFSWAICGPIFDFSQSWMLIMNTGSTIITFLMVFLIQKKQNKDSKAIQIKLNEIIAAHEGSSNRIVDIENLTEEELDQLHKFYGNLNLKVKKEPDNLHSHSIDAAPEIHPDKIVKRNWLHKLMNKK